MSKYFIVLISILFVGCAMHYTVTKDTIGGELEYCRGFEISKLSVSKFHSTKGYPIRYIKIETEICLIGDQKIPDNLLQLSLDEYWEDKDSIDYDSGSFLDKTGHKKIKFYEAQENVQWLRYPFKHDSLSKPILGMDFKAGTWYKLSHFYPKQTESDDMVFIYVESDGNLKTYQNF